MTSELDVVRLRLYVFVRTATRISTGNKRMDLKAQFFPRLER